MIDANAHDPTDAEAASLFLAHLGYDLYQYRSGRWAVEMSMSDEEVVALAKHMGMSRND